MPYYSWDSSGEPSPLCGSLRVHDEHEWRGQTTGRLLRCPGVRKAPAHMCAIDRGPDYSGGSRPCPQRNA